MIQKTRWVAASMAAVATWVLGSAAALGADPKLPDKITAYLGPGAKPSEAVVTIWMSNANPVIGITLPLKFVPGADSVVVDSLLTTTGRAAAFQVPPPMYKKENQTLLVNMLSAGDSAGMMAGAIPVGEGPIAVLYLGSKSAFPMNAFKIAAVRLPPENDLLYVTSSFNSVQPEFALVKKPAPPWPLKTGQAATKATGKTGKP
jgi:hypothetical protein